jgi:hypothetical protein
VILMGSISVAFFILYHEWVKPLDKDNDSIFD